MQTEVMKGSELVARRLTKRWPYSVINEINRQADPLRCMECHQKVRIQVYPSWRLRKEKYHKRKEAEEHVLLNLPTKV